MSSRLILIFSLAAILILQGCTGEGYTTASSRDIQKTLLKKYELYGSNSLDLSQGLSKISGSRASSVNWEENWAQIAREYEKNGNKFFEDNNIDNGVYNLLKAAVYYRIAALPYPDNKAKQEYYQKAAELHRKTIKFLSNPPKVISIAYETREIRGYLTIPAPGKKYPLVILLPGIDGVKEEFFWVEHYFTDKGYAVFTMDSPGTGESQWPLRLDSERVLMKALSYLKAIPEIEPDNINIIGFNLGGYWALRMAARDPFAIKSVAAVSPPLNDAFSSNRLNNLPKYLRDIFLQATGETKTENLVKTLSEFSLEKTDILRDIRGKILLVGTNNDIFTPASDVDYLANKSRQPIFFKLYDDEQFSLINNLSSFYEMSSAWLQDNN